MIHNGNGETEGHRTVTGMWHSREEQGLCEDNDYPFLLSLSYKPAL